MSLEETNRRDSMASSSDISFAETAIAGKLLSKKEKSSGAVKMKKSIAKKTKPKDPESNGTNTAGATRSPSPSSPIVTAITKLGEDRPVCKHCKKPVDQIHYDSHVSICLENKKEAAKRKKERKEAKKREAEARFKELQGEKDKDGDAAMGGTAPPASQDDVASINGDAGSVTGQSTKKPPKKSATKASADASKKTKKRKAEAESVERDPKKKKLKKDEPPKPKLPKPRGPVNVEIQCGVPLDKEKGGFCARSLTCKSHSMGLKRAVRGRSLPYDQLLAMYQKKNQAKQQKALMEAQVGALGDDEEAQNGVVDSEEEREAVMKGLGRWRPGPVEQMVTVPIGRRYRYVRLKEMLGNALGGGGRGLFGVPAAAATSAVGGGVEGIMEPPAMDADGRRPSGMGHAHPLPKGVAAPVRRPSVASSAGGA